MIYIFNSEKKFWNSCTRSFEEKPYAITSQAEAAMEMQMTARADCTCDSIYFPDGMQEEALKHIKALENTAERLELLQEINDSLCHKTI